MKEKLFIRKKNVSNVCVHRQNFAKKKTIINASPAPLCWKLTPMVFLYLS